MQTQLIMDTFEEEPGIEVGYQYFPLSYTVQIFHKENTYYVSEITLINLYIRYWKVKMSNSHKTFLLNFKLSILVT